MIITLKNADFSKSNIGTLTTWSVSRSLGVGATYVGPNFVDKDAALNATVTIIEGYEIGAAGVTVTMGGVGQAYTIVDNVITINIASVTGNVMIKVPTKNIATGEEEEPVNPPSGTLNVVWTVNASIGAANGKELTPQSNRSRTNSIKVSDLTGDITSGGTAARFIVSCYNSSGEYIGQINKDNINNDLIIGTGQWITKGTLISKTLLTSKGASTIRMVVDSQASGSTFIMDGQVIATTDDSGSDSGSGTTTYDYPFVTGSITKETGENKSGNRVRTDEYFEQSKLGTKFTVNECRFIVACYTSDKKYLGQYNEATDILDDTCLTAVTWNAAGAEVVTATIFSKQADILENGINTGNKGTVAYVRFVGETPYSNPHLYVDDIKLTE